MRETTAGSGASWRSTSGSRSVRLSSWGPPPCPRRSQIGETCHGASDARSEGPAMLLCLSSRQWRSVFEKSFENRVTNKEHQRQLDDGPRQTDPTSLTVTREFGCDPSGSGSEVLETDLRPHWVALLIEWAK